MDNAFRGYDSWLTNNSAAEAAAICKTCGTDYEVEFDADEDGPYVVGFTDMCEKCADEDDGE